MKKRSKKKSADDFLREEFDFSKAEKGTPLHPAKTKILRSFRIDADVILWLQDTAPNGVSLNTHLNSVLREQMEGRSTTVESRLSAIEKRLKMA